MAPHPRHNVNVLRTRIIPKLLLLNGRTVKGRRFEDMRDTGNPVTNARIYDAQGVDELIFLDIEATGSSRGLLFDTIAKTAEQVFMPFCVGGGVRSLDDIKSLLRAGADKIAINTAAVENPHLVSDGAKTFGRQCIVASIDFRRKGDRAIVFTHGGKTDTGLDVLTHAVGMAESGAGEILLTSIDRDGSMEGYDLEITRRVTNAVDIPVIASGGPGTLQHLVEAVEEAGVSAVAVGSLFHFTDQSPIKARSFMATAGVPVRMQV